MQDTPFTYACSVDAKSSQSPNASLFTLESMQFFGRVASDYEAMFAIRLAELSGKHVLDCPSGPSSFVSEANAVGVHAIGVDPLYDQPLEVLLQRGAADVDYTMARMGDNSSEFGDVNLQAYASSKLQAMIRFARGFEQGKANGVYRAAQLPNLPFADGAFDLVLSGHLLLTYSSPESGGILPNSDFSLAWHVEAVMELVRVCRGEVRLYPTTTRWKTPCRHPYAEAIAEHCTSRGMRVRYEPSSFARGHHVHDALNACMVISR